MHPSVKKSVAVVLSTFNGQKFLPELINSVLNQNNVNVSIYIRDDGSTDTSIISFLKRYEKSEHIHITYGQNIGVTKSFLCTLSDVPDNYDYYAFCDQDDIWLPEKLEHAIALLEKKTSPKLYCSTQYILSENHKLNNATPPPKRAPSFNNAMVENVVTGCTAVFDKSIKRLATKPTSREKIILHDWWLYLVASHFGNIIFDDAPHILYRQHNQNLVGANTNTAFITTARAVLRNLFSPKKRLCWLEQLSNFSYTFSDELDPSQANKIAIIVEGYNKGIIDRIKISLTASYYRQKKLETFLFKLSYCLGLF
ncbi:glycosyltransferase family 2 protein [Hahella ganghwensis]|uniref:glycosyltransferase family 2 protein n=1 Tax=Hahella ganghwensis TaxID=286420 RepID=UPI00036D6990|nr:glycosyltransferase family 2 protein [Hahella ganghwensis]